MTTIWIDADACPRALRAILFKAADRRQVPMRLVANQSIPVPRSPWISSLTVPHGFDAADDYIVAHAEVGDVAVTQDIPLAAQLVEKCVAVIDLRGRELDARNIGSRLATRNLLEEMRGAGIQTGGPSAFGDRDKQAFANAFDRVLTRALRTTT